jgi:hypothetical protein
MARILSAVIEDGKRVPQLGDHQRSRERGDSADHHRDIIAEPLHTRALTGQKRAEEGRRGQKRAEEGATQDGWASPMFAVRE